MTVSVTFTGVDPVEGQYEDGPFDLASIGSWSEFAAWAAAEPLPPGPLLELTAHGLCANTIGLVEGLRERIDRGPPPPGIGATVDRLLELVGEGAAEEVVVVLDEEPGDPRPTGNAWLDDPDEDEVDADVFAGPDPEDQWDEPEVGGASDSVVSNEDLLAMLDPEAPVVNYPGQPRDNLGRFGTGTYAKSVEATKRASGLLGEYKKTGRLTPEQGKELMDSLHTMTVKQLKQLKKDHGIRASGARKSELAHRLASKLQRQYEGKAAQRAGLETKGTTKKGGRDGEVTTGPGPKSPGGADGGRGGSAGGATPPSAGGRLEKEAGGAGSPAADQGRPADDQPAGGGAAASVPRAQRRVASKEEATRRLDRMADFFRRKGNHEAAHWMDQIKDHVGKVGTEEALKGLGDDLGDSGKKKVQYKGMWENEQGGLDFINGMVEPYLRKHGVIPTTEKAEVIPGAAVVSPRTVERGEAVATGGHAPIKQQLTPSDFRAKLEEAKRLPGLERSEDLAKFLGGKAGGSVRHLTPEVTKKLDEKFGEGGWIVKAYSEGAYAGHGVYFPQKAKQIQKDAQDTIWASGGELGRYGFSHLRDKAGRIYGIKHSDGKEYPFHSAAYQQTITGHAREVADRVREAAKHEHGAQLPEQGRGFMVQPAFPVVGVTEEERAKGVLFGSGEGRVHIVTRDGKAEVVPHSTWMKGKDKWESMPVVFETEDHRAMQKAAIEAINALPPSERQGQIYGPDIVKTKDGYRVVEANPANEAGGSGALGDNPFIIDAYASHVVGKTPAHVRFIRDMLTKRGKGGQQT